MARRAILHAAARIEQLQLGEDLHVRLAEQPA
jgi:hypothetical protein